MKLRRIPGEQDPDYKAHPMPLSRDFDQPKIYCKLHLRQLLFRTAGFGTAQFLCYVFRGHSGLSPKPWVRMIILFQKHLPRKSQGKGDGGSAWPPPTASKPPQFGRQRSRSRERQSARCTCLLAYSRWIRLRSTSPGRLSTWSCHRPRQAGVEPLNLMAQVSAFEGVRSCAMAELTF